MSVANSVAAYLPNICWFILEMKETKEEKNKSQEKYIEPTADEKFDIKFMQFKFLQHAHINCRRKENQVSFFSLLKAHVIVTDNREHGSTIVH